MNLDGQRSERIVLDDECQELTGLSKSTRYREELAGRFPRRRQLAGKRIGWLLTELIDWMGRRPTTRPIARRRAGA